MYLVSKDKECGHNQANASIKEILSQWHLHIKHSKGPKHGHSDHFLHDLKLSKAQVVYPYSIGRNLEAVFKKGYSP